MGSYQDPISFYQDGLSSESDRVYKRYWDNSAKAFKIRLLAPRKRSDSVCYEPIPSEERIRTSREKVRPQIKVLFESPDSVAKPMPQKVLILRDRWKNQDVVKRSEPPEIIRPQIKVLFEHPDSVAKPRPQKCLILRDRWKNQDVVKNQNPQKKSDRVSKAFLSTRIPVQNRGRRNV